MIRAAYLRTYRRTRRRLTTKVGGIRAPHAFTRWTVPPTPAVGGIPVTYGTGNGLLTVTGDAVNTESRGAFAFTLADVGNVSEFTSLFDQYKILGILVTVKMLNSPDAVNVPNGLSANTGCYYPTLWYATDYDDNSVATVANLREYVRVKHKVLRPNSEIRIFLKPTTLEQVYRTAVTTGYAVNFNRPWLDCAQTDIPHYGLKYAIDFEGITPANGQVWTFKFNAKYYLKMKNPR